MRKPTYKELSSEQLWLLAIENDHRAFKEIYDRSYLRLYHYGIKFFQSKAQVEDAIQEIFLDLWQKRNNRKDIRNIQYYLLKSLKYKLLAMTSGSNIIDIESSPMALKLSTKTITETLSLESVQQVQYQLSQLSRNQQEVLHLKYYQGLSNQEIATFLDINYQSVSNLIHRAISALKKNFVKKVSM